MNPANPSPKHIILIAMGAGTGTLTLDAQAALRDADCVIGSRRLIEEAGALDRARCFTLIDAEEICRRIDVEAGACFAVLFSGDTGFFSGAKRLLPLLRERGWKRTVIPGVSSPALLAARLETSWDDAALVSLHGRSGETAYIAGAVTRNAKTFFLTGGEISPRFVCATLRDAGLGHLWSHIGEHLGSAAERISSGCAADFAERDFDALSVIMVEHPAPLSGAVSVLPDEFFARGKTPMTKAEVRAVSLDKLRLSRRSVVWDVGAGTGAAACDMARRAGMVYAVEKDASARALIELNRRRLGIANLRVIAGRAPLALKTLPTPGAVFIGGSSGELAGIFQAALAKNPAARLVVTAITPETAVEASRLVETYQLNAPGMIHLAVSRAEKAGTSHLLKALNPVFIIWGGGEDQITPLIGASADG